jgi:molybdopterin molybdotransferase
MTNIQDAFNIINQTVKKAAPICIPLNQSLGFVLSKEIHSEIHMPPFNQSAMDGYAINSINLDLSEIKFKLMGEIKAGDDASCVKLKSKEAIRIFTGAMVPSGTTQIAQQEIVLKEGNHIRIEKPLKDGANIRLKGEQIEKGSLVCPEGTKLNAGTIGYLASLGIKTVHVYQQPKICIINTGDELQTPGESLDMGKVYESNGIMLTSLLDEMKLVSSRHRVKDNLKDTKDTIEHMAKEHDVLIITGGISVGDYDFVGTALESLNCEKHFYKVKQKPGKPLYYGILNGTYVFALPGNPAAVMTCFQMYVKPALQLISGYAEENTRPSFMSKLSHDYIKKGDKPIFLKAFIDLERNVTLLSHQSSAMLNSFVQANCFAFIDAETNLIKNGEEILVYPIV